MIFIQAQAPVQLNPSLFTRGARAAWLTAQCGNTSGLLGSYSKQLVINVLSFLGIGCLIALSENLAQGHDLALTLRIIL